MKFRRLIFLSVIMLVMLAAGYIAGRSVEARPGGNLVPGSASDPVVSESYLRQTVAEATASLQAQLSGLQARVEELTRTIAILEGQPPGLVSGPAPVPPPQIKPQPVQTMRRAKVIVSSANVRSGPGTEFSRIAGLRQGALVTIREEKSGWYKIEYSPGKTGWILGRLLQLQ